MTHFDSIILPYLILWPPLGYIAVFIVMMFEGDAALFIAAFLTSQGYFDFWDMAFTVFCGMIVGDLLWYWAGFHLHNLSSFLSVWSERIAKPFDAHLLKNPFRTIFVSKFTYGVHHAILLRAGTLKMSVRTYVKNDVMATLIWMTIVGGLGYTAGASLVLVKHYLKFAEVGLLIALIIFFGLEYFIRQRSKKNL